MGEIRKRPHPPESFLDGAIDCDTTVGTYDSAGSASDTAPGVVIVDEVIASVVDILGLKMEYIAGACHHTEVASFTSLAIDFYRAYNFWHI